MTTTLSPQLKQQLLGRAKSLVGQAVAANAIAAWHSDGDREKSGRVGRTQFRALVDLAMAASLEDEVVAAIAYRGGKANKGKGWATFVGEDNRTLAQRLNEEIRSVAALVKETAPAGAEPSESEIVAVLAIFLGYIYWEVTARGQSAQR